MTHEELSPEACAAGAVMTPRTGAERVAASLDDSVDETDAVGLKLGDEVAVRLGDSDCVGATEDDVLPVGETDVGVTAAET